MQLTQLAPCPAVQCAALARSSARGMPAAKTILRQLVQRHAFTSKRPQRRAALAVQASGVEVEITVEEDAMDKMEKTLASVRGSFATVRTGRANTQMLDRIEVDYYGAPTPLKQIAGVTAPEASMLVVQPYDISAIPAIEKAIMTSDLGLTPSNDGRIIRLNIPQLTADRRKEMAKIVSKLGEEGKVAVRNVRREAMKTVEKLEKDGAVSEDARKGLETAVQELTDEYVKQIDALVKAKSDELNKV